MNMFWNSTLRKSWVRLLVLMVLQAPGIVAKAEPHLVHRGIPHDRLYDISVRGKNAIAVGDFGVLLTSSDGGHSWHPDRSLVTDRALLGLVYAENKTVVVGQMGFIAIRENKVWTILDAMTSERLFSVDMNASGLAVAVGGFGTLLISTDGAQSWESAVIEWPDTAEYTDPHFYDVNVSSKGVITIVGEFSTVIQSRDRGQTWSTLYRGESSLFALHMDDSGLGYAVGQKGTILRTQDGVIWRLVPSDSEANLLNVLPLDDNKLIISGMGILRYSHDGGESWKDVKDENRDFETGWYQASSWVESTQESAIYFAGHQGRIIRLQMEDIEKNDL